MAFVYPTKTRPHAGAESKPSSDTAKAAQALRRRINWSKRLREDHRLLAPPEKLT
jgi:hypothetical protein